MLGRNRDGDGKKGDRVEKNIAGKRKLEEKDVRWVMGRKVSVVKRLDGKSKLGTVLIEGESTFTDILFLSLSNIYSIILNYSNLVNSESYYVSYSVTEGNVEEKKG